MLPFGSKEDATILWQSLDFTKMLALHDEAYEKITFRQVHHAKIKDKERTNDLFSYGNSILQVHGYIHKKKVIVSINPSFQHNFMNGHLDKKLQVPTNHIQSTRVEGENVKFLRI